VSTEDDKDEILRGYSQESPDEWLLYQVRVVHRVLFCLPRRMSLNALLRLAFPTFRTEHARRRRCTLARTTIPYMYVCTIPYIYIYTCYYPLPPTTIPYALVLSVAVLVG